MRDAFINTLTQLAENDKDIVLLTGDLGFSVICVVFENDFLAADNLSDDIT